MLKGHRTYLTIAATAAFNVLTQIQPALSGKPAVVVNSILMVAGLYFRSKA